MQKSFAFVLFIGLFTVLSCNKTESDIRINMHLLFDGEPLVMFQDYNYPDGKKINFTRVSFFISDLEVQADSESEIINSADFLNFTESHSTLAGANDGLEVFSGTVPIGEINGLSFNIGLTQAQNETIPADYPADHVLASTGEYWIGWSSYIFVKIEGQVDLDQDGMTETNVALHLGSNEVRRPVVLSGSPTGNEYRLEMDVRDIFQSQSLYDIESNPQIHHLGQINAILELADNMSAAFSIK